jgi:hypothetical protein
VGVSLEPKALSPAGAWPPPHKVVQLLLRVHPQICVVASHPHSSCYLSSLFPQLPVFALSTQCSNPTLD